MRFPIEFVRCGDARNAGKNEQLEITASFSIRPMRVGLSVVAFVVDTGCDISFISYGDACKLNIPLNGLPEKGETHIGNTTFVMSELPVFGLTLESEAGEPVRIDVDHFHVAKTRKKSIADVELAKAIPSILGLDFMRRNRLALHVEPANNLAYFEKIG